MLRKLCPIISPIILALACFLLAGCDQKALVEKFVPKDDDAMARRFLEMVRTGDYAAATQMLDAALQGGKAEEGLRSLNTVLAHGKQLSVEVIGCNSVSSLGDGTKRTDLTYQIRFADAWAVGYVNIQHYSGGNTTILASRFQWVPDSLENINRFTFSGKSVAHYLVFAICIAMPLFIIFTLVVCIRTPVRRRKWLWVIFILLGFGKFQFAWTSGQFGVQPLSFLFLGASVFRPSLYASWVFSFAVPLGAIIFLGTRRKLRAPDKPKEPALPPLPPLPPITTT